MKQEFIDRLKKHEEILDLALNHGQTYDPSNKAVKDIVSIYKELNPDAKKFCETCWADTMLKVMDVATDYFKAVAEPEIKPNTEKQKKK